MPIIRANHSRGRFVQIDNTSIRDRRLSGEARGALTWFLSQKPTFEPSAECLVGEGFGARDRCQRIMMELRKYGYATTNNVAIAGGRRRCLTTVREIPQEFDNDDSPEPENTAPVTTSPEPCSPPAPESTSPVPENPAAREGRRNNPNTEEPRREESLPSASPLAGAPRMGAPSSQDSKRSRASAAEIQQRIRQPKWLPKLTAEELRAAFALTFEYAGFPKPRTSAEHGRWGKAVKDLMDSGATPREFYLAALVAKSRWAEAPASPTPMAIVANLALLLEDMDVYGDEKMWRGDHEYGQDVEWVEAWGMWLETVGEYRLCDTIDGPEPDDGDQPF